MNRIRYFIFFLFFLTGIFTSCISTNEDIYKKETVENPGFKQYWYNNEAELTRYELQQARYGELREGNAVLIFVTEDFFAAKQVKYEHGKYRDATPVLKLNFQREFKTGIYPYSTLISVFSPLFLNGQKALKVTSSFQEWCGMVFQQLNLKGSRYRIQLNSYFQNEGDKTYSLANVLLEDELWTKIRINPDTIPVGKIDIIPATTHSRFKHIPLKVESAHITIDNVKDDWFSNDELKRLTLEYTTIRRKMVIFFDKEFPHAIAGWEETYPDGFGDNVKNLTTTAVRTHSIKLDYWNHNKPGDSALRDSLGI